MITLPCSHQNIIHPAHKFNSGKSAMSNSFSSHSSDEDNAHNSFAKIPDPLNQQSISPLETQPSQVTKLFHQSPPKKSSTPTASASTLSTYSSSSALYATRSQSIIPSTSKRIFESHTSCSSGSLGKSTHFSSSAPPASDSSTSSEIEFLGTSKHGSFSKTRKPKPFPAVRCNQSQRKNKKHRKLPANSSPSGLSIIVVNDNADSTKHARANAAVLQGSDVVDGGSANAAARTGKQNDVTASRTQNTSRRKTHDSSTRPVQGRHAATPPRSTRPEEGRRGGNGRFEVSKTPKAKTPK